MKFNKTIKSTTALAIFITAAIPTSQCNAVEPTTEKSAAASYRLLDASGKLTRTDVRCATAAVSDLTWELKTDDNGIHDKDNFYRWGGIGAEKNGKIFFDDWNDLLNATNSEKLCGFNDWRVPTIDELKTLVTNYGVPITEKNPMIDTSVFPLTLTMPYWSVSTYQHYPEHAQTVDFATGASNYYTGFRGDRLPLRLVRSDKVLSEKVRSEKVRSE